MRPIKISLTRNPRGDVLTVVRWHGAEIMTQQQVEARYFRTQSAVLVLQVCEALLKRVWTVTL